jgi:hypothetical protein
LVFALTRTALVGAAVTFLLSCGGGGRSGLPTSPPSLARFASEGFLFDNGLPNYSNGEADILIDGRRVASLSFAGPGIMNWIFGVAPPSRGAHKFSVKIISQRAARVSYDCWGNADIYDASGNSIFRVDFQEQTKTLSIGGTFDWTFVVP